MANYKRTQTIRVRKRKPAAGVKKNARAIAKLSKMQFKKCQYYTEYLSDNAPNILLVKCVNPVNWKGIFASNTNNERQDRFYLDRVDIRMNLAVSSSGLTTVSPFFYHMFVVSLRPTYAKSTYYRTGKMTVLKKELDYHETSIGTSVGAAQWQLNPMLYNVKAQRSGMIGDFANEGLISAPGLSSGAASAVTNIRDANKNFHLKVPWKKILKRGVGELTPGNITDWKDMTTDDIANPDQLYVLVFHSAYGTQELAVHTGITAHGRSCD